MAGDAPANGGPTRTARQQYPWTGQFVRLLGRGLVTAWRGGLRAVVRDLVPSVGPWRAGGEPGRAFRCECGVASAGWCGLCLRRCAARRGGGLRPGSRRCATRRRRHSAPLCVRGSDRQLSVLPTCPASLVHVVPDPPSRPIPRKLVPPRDVTSVKMRCAITPALHDAPMRACVGGALAVIVGARRLGPRGGRTRFRRRSTAARRRRRWRPGAAAFRRCRQKSGCRSESSCGRAAWPISPRCGGQRPRTQ